MMNGQEKQRHTSGSGERSYSTTAEETEHYTGLNRLFHSDALQAILRHIDDGTLSEFFDDWKWIFSFSRKYKWIIVFYTLVGIFGSTLSLGSAWLSRTLINIVVHGVENTIRAVSDIAREGMRGTDKEVIKLMMSTS